MRILHITESLGGGVTTAINSYVKNSPEFDHFLLASVRISDRTGEESIGGFKGVKIIKRNLFSVLYLKKFVREFSADVIHVHSSYAGVIVRLLFDHEKIPVVYTPHGFSFLRDDHPWVRKIYYILENALGYRTSVIAGCSKDESNIASMFSSGVKSIPLVNVCDPLDLNNFQSADGFDKRDSQLVIGMVGRVTNQKGFTFFSEIAKTLGSKCRFKWIGGGENKAVDILEQAGVEVTGWISRKEVIEHLSALDVYFHSAAWDGFPISVLEAAELSLPIILRSIGPFTAEGLSTVSDITEASVEISSLVAGDEDAWQRAKLNTEKIRGYHTQENLSKALHDLYSQFSK